VRVWVDLSNSPHVPLLHPIVQRLEEEGHDVVLSARDHAQTLELARQHWPDIEVVGSATPIGRVRKAMDIAGRARALRRFARRERPDVAFSHGSYAQLAAARTLRMPSVTMMDYEHQPANHVSFRLANRVVVPEVFPTDALRRFGARPTKVVHYPGFKEELYLEGFRPDPRVLQELGLDPRRVIAVFRPPPYRALYHQMANDHFDEVLAEARQQGAQIVLLPRDAEQARRYGDGAIVARRAVDGPSLLALADLVVGAGGTMNRESALLGTPTYTVFAGELAAVDAELIRRGLLHDLRDEAAEPEFRKRDASDSRPVLEGQAIMTAILQTLDSTDQWR
jgi:uncharacterized protein